LSVLRGSRSLGLEKAASLNAGEEHYRAYVGPPDRFDLMGASQFNLLCTLRLRDYHNVLDFGCGSLRLGRLLILYLQRGKYFGIDPNRWLIDDALRCELGWDIVSTKEARFSYEDFDCSVFGERFHLSWRNQLSRIVGRICFSASCLASQTF
jgi:SAM-dependent methyltransferase